MSPVIRHADGQHEVYATEPPRGTPSGPARRVARATVWARSVPATVPYLRRSPEPVESRYALRRTGSRKAVCAELGIVSLQAVTSSLLEALAKGLLPADLPDLPPRILRRLPAPAQANA